MPLVLRGIAALAVNLGIDGGCVDVAAATSVGHRRWPRRILDASGEDGSDRCPPCAMPIDEDSIGCHDAAPAAASASVVLPPSMTKSVSYMSSTSNSSYSTSNTGYLSYLASWRLSNTGWLCFGLLITVADSIVSARPPDRVQLRQWHLGLYEDVHIYLFIYLFIG